MQPALRFFLNTHEKIISRAFFLRDIHAEGGLSWPQGTRRSWQGHGEDKESVGSWGQKAERDETSRYFFLRSLFLFATGRMVLCLVGVHAVFSVVALTFNQY